MDVISGQPIRRRRHWPALAAGEIYRIAYLGNFGAEPTPPNPPPSLYLHAALCSLHVSLNEAIQ